ncbi:MAG: hypothetical protein OEM25_00910 [Gammaproteobacteria bacterium]|nr:hypothetical protein [Gammaproteobacteria bacterium]
MFKKDKSASDNFTLSLGGLTTISSFAAAPAVANDRLRQVQDGQVRNACGQKCRLWVPRRFRVA